VPGPPGDARRSSALLLVLALVVLTANIGGITLPPIDDCFYARKGVEMERRGAFFTVTWNGQPSFTYPSLQFWILGRSFALFGENDAAARLPGALMATAIVAATGWIGAQAAFPVAGVTGMALLLASPYFLNNARRCMTEVPLAFWTTMSLVVLLAGLRRPRLHLLLALPLAAGILTKSLLGFLPLLAYGGGALFSRELRRPLGRPWLWAGVMLGLAGGATWTVHQWRHFGAPALEEHYVTGVLAISTRPIGWLQRLTGYPLILLTWFQPVVIPAVMGLWFWWRNRGGLKALDLLAHPSLPGARALVAAWWIVPFVLYAASSTQSARYLFPAFPAMAAIGGMWLTGRFPRFASVFRGVVVPAALGILALLYWVAPQALSRDPSRAYVTGGVLLRSRIPPDEPLTFLGHDYWRFANPLLYYNERTLEPSPNDSADESILRALTRSSRLLLVEKPRLAEVQQTAPEARVVLELPTGVVVSLGEPPARDGH